MKRISTLVLLLSCLAHETHVRAANFFYFTSAPSAWVGQGTTQTLTPPEYTISSFRDPNTNMLAFEKNSANRWEVEFGGAKQNACFVGSHRRQAYPFNDTHPGLAFEGNSRGNNTLTGSFQVLEAVFDSGTTFRKAADFVGHDSEELDRWNRGSIRFNSDIAIVPEPSAEALFSIASLVIASRRHGRKSVSHNRV